jgi:GWxTD domain-containing protein
MNKIHIAVLTLLLAGLVPASAQLGQSGRNRDGFGADLFQIRFYCSALPENTPQANVEAFVQLANDALTFIKVDSTTWRAHFDLELMIYSSRKEMAAYHLLRDTVTVRRFELTNTRLNPLKKTILFTLQPGEYNWRLKLLNAEGLPLLEREERLQVPEYSPQELHISDIKLVDSLDCAAGVYAINPSGIFNRQRGSIGAIFEIYPPAGADSVQTLLTLTDLSGQGIMEKKIVRRADPLLHFCVELGGLITKPGEYLFRIRTSAGARNARADQRIMVLWGAAPAQQESGDLAIAQLALIARGNTIRALERAKGEERERLLQEFWQKRDPTPGTPENELKNEFFMRIDFANHRFSEGISGRQGWRSDRGRIFIQNGTPDQIEKQTGEMGMPSSEIWTYNRLNRRYLFIDRLNNGEFRLVKTD